MKCSESEDFDFNSPTQLSTFIGTSPPFTPFLTFQYVFQNQTNLINSIRKEIDENTENLFDDSADFCSPTTLSHKLISSPPKTPFLKIQGKAYINIFLENS